MIVHLQIGFSVIIGHQLAVHVGIKIECQEPLDVGLSHSPDLESLRCDTLFDLGGFAEHLTGLQILEGGELMGYAACEVNWGQIMKELSCYNEGSISKR